MNAVGMNTAQSTRAVAMIGPVTSFMAWRVASTGDLPRPMLRSTFSTTTMASSTTMPMASTRPNSDSALSETEQVHHREGADQRHRHGGQRNDRGAPGLQEQDHHQHHQHDGLEQGVPTASMEPRTKMVGS